MVKAKDCTKFPFFRASCPVLPSVLGSQGPRGWTARPPPGTHPPCALLPAFAPSWAPAVTTSPTICSRSSIKSVLVWAEQRQRLMSYHFTRRRTSRFKGGEAREDEPVPGRAGRLSTMASRSRRPTLGGGDAPTSRASEVYCTRRQCPHTPGRPGVGTQGLPAGSRNSASPGETKAGGWAWSGAACGKPARAFPALTGTAVAGSRDEAERI